MCRVEIYGFVVSVGLDFQKPLLLELGPTCAICFHNGHPEKTTSRSRILHMVSKVCATARPLRAPCPQSTGIEGKGPGTLWLVWCDRNHGKIGQVYLEETMVLPWSYHGLTMVLPWSYHGLTMVLPLKYGLFPSLEPTQWNVGNPTVNAQFSVHTIPFTAEIGAPHQSSLPSDNPCRGFIQNGSLTWLNHPEISMYSQYSIKEPQEGTQFLQRFHANPGFLLSRQISYIIVCVEKGVIIGVVPNFIPPTRVFPFLKRKREQFHMHYMDLYGGFLK